MSEQNEIITSNGHQIEKSMVTDTPLEAALPLDGERLVVGAIENSESKQGATGLEVVSLAGYPRNERGEIEYRGILLSGKLEAIIVDPAVTPDFATGTGFKGLRKNEVVPDETLTKRFGKEAGFNLGLDQEGKVMIENKNPQTPLNVLSIKPIETPVEDQAVESVPKLLDLTSKVAEASPQAPEVANTSEELRVEAAEDLGEIAIERATEVNTSKIYSHELRAMRQAAEAAKRATGVESIVTNPYDALLDPNTPNIEAEKPIDVYAYLKEALPPVTRGTTEASGKYYDKFVTDENRQVSLDFLSEVVKADAHIAGIIYEAGLEPTDMATVDAIRENPDIRYKVAKRLTQKLDTLADQDPEGFGFRVAVNSPNNLKSDGVTGKRMKSRMYAVDMALKMLGGEFSERTQDDDFARDKNDRVANGQHRHAARTVIMSRHA